MTAILAEDLSTDATQYLTTLEGFARVALGFGDEIYPEMLAVMRDLEQPAARVSVRTANGAGKTTRLITAAILWHLAVFPRSKVVSTTGAHLQLREQLMPALMSHQFRMGPQWEFRHGSATIQGPNKSRYIGFVTNEPGRAEGHHGNKDPFFDLETDGGPLLIIVDEAKTVPDEIFEAIERCTYQRLLVCSSPGFADGEFYRSHTSKARFWKPHHIPAKVCAHIDHAKNERLIEELGEEHALVRSKVYAEFMDQTEDAVVDLQMLDRCRRLPPAYHAGEVRAMCDFAAGGDENVLAVRRGNRVTIVDAWREKDTVRAVHRFINLFKQEGLEPAWIYGDNDGLGKPMIDSLHHLKWTINRLGNGRPAWRKQDYLNYGSETWFRGRTMIDRSEIILPDDEMLATQLVSRKEKTNQPGKLQVESKQQMKRRGIPSPDRADAVLEAMRPSVTLQPQDEVVAAWNNQWGEDLEDQQMSMLPGAFAGV